MSAARIEQIQQLLSEDPSDAFLNYALALEIAKEGKIEAAISIIEKLLESQPDYLGAYYQLAKWYEEKNEIEKAKVLFERGCILAEAKKDHRSYREMKEALLNLDC